MQTPPPWPRSEAVVNIAAGVILTLITCGLYGLFWQYKQMETLNAWLGRPRFDFWTWLLLSLITCGLYAIYYEYKMAQGINDVQHARGMRVQNDLGVLCVLLSAFGLWIVSLAVQQSAIDGFYDHHEDL